MKFQQNFSQQQQQKQMQKLAMTQQLQQSLQVLQYNSEQLVDYIENKALENPLIEVIPPSITPDYGRGSNSWQGENNFINQIPETNISLFEYLINQVHLNYRDTYLRKLVLFLVEYIDVNGYLKLSLEEAQAKTGADTIQMLDALTLIQQLDPAGVGARNLQECLMLQTERDNNAPNLAYIVLEEGFDDLVNRQWEKIAKKFGVQLSDIQKVFDYIQTLSPAPGSGFNHQTELYVVPDLRVKVIDDEIKVSSNRKGQPEIKLQEGYFERMKQQADQATLDYLKEKQQEFDWLKRTMLQRGDTILKVGTAIIERQTGFFLEASRPIQALTMKEIAEQLEIHESTVSRSVNGKYLETDFGIFELKTFFTNKIASSNNGADQSADSVKQQLKKVIEEENKNRPYSDQKLADLLKADGAQISRRTVTKYREALGIPTSSKRKRYDD
ncbi:RNA polymerase sigma-54 factor [Enterococcus sp. PF1-24]|uniref:RNA polymerase factor sigma-54 n=1 Tax=unclassified Enterococcus TaxID=2608891 RepID=UPI0024732161|nr:MULTISPECIES: RNA polymerase factor sigma-54 [unclassified Enterococcus]MDH6364634.1 RNA polymerase sigma-54 factor [Enterococcus sp. PFB1-1]MDH6401735.1 RNA polymerase sigma-54 factor [Enterococcus sp. PF1-24]